MSTVKPNMSLTKRSNKVLARIEKWQALQTQDGAGIGYLEERSRLVSQGVIFAFLCIANLMVIASTMYVLDQGRVIKFFSTSYTAEIEKMKYLPSKRVEGGYLVKFKLGEFSEEEPKILKVSDKQIKGL